MHKKNVIIDILHNVNNNTSHSIDNYTLKMYKRRNNINIKHYQGLIVGVIVFASIVFFPRISYWIEAQGLNNLYSSVRIVLILIAIVVGILTFVIGRKMAAFKTTHYTPAEYMNKHIDAREITNKENKEEVIEKALKQIEIGLVSPPVIFVIGLFSLLGFYYDSSFRILLLGISCTFFSGLLAIYCEDYLLRRKVIKQYQSKSISDMNDSSNSHTSSSESRIEINKFETESTNDISNDNSKAGNRRGIAGEIDWDNISK